PRAAEKGLELVYDVDDDVPDVLTGDVTRLRQVLVNLLSNAVKFTGAGEVVIHCRLHAQVGPQLALAFAVRDTGIGIPAAHMDRLFVAFSQLDASTTRQYGGTGLGLVISKHLVDMMGGEIWVDSSVDEGSTFHFTFLAQAYSDQTAAHQVEPHPALAGKHVLVVAEDNTNRALLLRLLANWR
ncbi:MAG: hybrid sensor histidine kinase/response regulator, partial [Candidatus Competibacteraceae bacterium]|nr:hybrid sensor histidine kinase/response regulator [Candidatus Competibacteraceae bacterium]